MKALVLSFALVFVGCGGSDKPAAAVPDGTGDGDTNGEHMDGEHGGEMGHEHDFPPSMRSFHDVLAPLWHAEQGEQRMADTCARIDDFVHAYDGLVTAGSPEGTPDEMVWDEAVSRLDAAIGALEGACTDAPDDLDAFQAQFQTLHDAFHALMEAAGMEH